MVKSPRLVVVTMVQGKDFPSAWSSLRPLNSQLSDQRERIILLNDDRNPELEAALASLPHTSLLLPGTNLGVARGRNLLFAAAIERGGDFVAVLDDDLYVPSDYLDIIAGVVAGSEDNLGIIAPTVMAFTDFAEANEGLVDASAAVFGELVATVSSGELRCGIDPDDESMFYHLGVRDWRTHYLSPSSEPGRRLMDLMIDGSLLEHSYPKQTTFLRSDTTARSIAADRRIQDPQWVDTVAGGVSVFSAGMLKTIGMCDERFSPFGYEDADLCIRARQAGYRNAWIPATLVLHDFQERGAVRSPEYLNVVSGRARAVLGANHLSSDELTTQAAFGMSGYLADALRYRFGHTMRREHVLASIAAFVIGYLDGATIPDSDGTTLLDRLSDISAGHALSTSSGRRWILHRLSLQGGEMAPVLSADVAIDDHTGAHTTATFSLRFPDGLVIGFRVVFSRNAVAAATTLHIHHLSLRVSGLGLTTQRISRSVGAQRFKAVHTSIFGDELPLESVLERTIRQLFSPTGGSRSGTVRIDPQPPISLEELASTQLDTARGIARLGLFVTLKHDIDPLGAETCWNASAT